MADPPKIYCAGTLTYTRMRLAVLFFWLLWGDFCYVLMENIVPSILPLKLKVLGASNTSLGLILTTIPMTIYTLLNPVISFKSDRYRSRWGRRIPFILFTLPFLVLFLIGIGMGDKIGFWIYPYIHRFTDRITPNQAATLIIAFMMILFSFFNTFVNSVFWYLFNDVVPEMLLARFMSWFRMVSMVAASCYNFFIFKYAETHSAAIFIGASLLYFFGFGLMCLNVREGRYPPPPKYVDGQSGFRSAVKTFGKECHSLSHYWYVFLVSICLGGAAGITPFILYFYLSTGLNLEMIGKVNGVTTVAVSILILGSGWLADRYHPIRIVIVGLLLQMLLAGAQMIWLFWTPSPQVSFYLWLAIVIGLCAPSAALLGVMDPPMFMRIFPRERYGQFCSANAMWRAGAMILSGLLAGIYFDVLKRYVGSVKAYCFLPVWPIFFEILALFCMVRLYRSWKKYGGDEAYVPPEHVYEKDQEKER